MRFRIFISSEQKEFAEERRMLLIEMSLQQSIQFLRAEVGAQLGRSQGAVATGEMFDLVGGIRIEAERDCGRGENVDCEDDVSWFRTERLMDGQCGRKCRIQFDYYAQM